MEKDDDASRWAVAYTFQVGVRFEKKMINVKVFHFYKMPIKMKVTNFYAYFCHW